MLSRVDNNLSRKLRYACATVRALLVVGACALVGPVFADENRILVIGAISSKNYDVSQSLQPMASYIKEKMADLGIEDVVVIAAPDRERLAQLIRHGRVDWISQTAYNASYFIQNADVSVLSRGWRGGSPTYRSIFFVRNDSELIRLDQVSNHVIAFEHPYSTSAYFVPRIELEAMGNSLSQQAVGQTRLSSDSITYTFSQSEYNTAVWVDKGIVDVGVISDSRWNDSETVPDGFRRSLRVLHETQEVVRALELVRGNLDADIKERLDTILQSIHADTAAKSVRSAYFDTQRFDKPTEQDISRLNEFAAHNGATAPQAQSASAQTTRSLENK